MKQRTWGGRFRKSQSKKFMEYSASINFDKRLAPFDLFQNAAYAKALHKAKLLKKSELDRLLGALNGIKTEFEKGRLKLRIEDEDIHMNIERRLSEKIGALAGKLHTGRSRNDQVATDARLYAREAINDILKLLENLQKAFVQNAEKNIDAFMPGCTHLQPAQPIRIAHWFLAYREMFARDAERFRETLKRTNVLPLGSGALAGTNFDIDRKYLAGLLGFDGITQNSLDAVSDRDFALDFCYAVSMFFSHLSRFSEEVVIFSSAEWGALILPDELCTGSSIMPQKKNPDLPELFRGKTGRVTGNLFNLLMIVKGLPLAYNKDLQEDKPPLFDSADQALAALPMAVELVKKIKFNKSVLKKRIGENFITAVDLADYLVQKGLPFREAHGIVGSLVRECEELSITFSDLTLGQLKKRSGLFDKKFLSYCDPALSTDRKKGVGSTSKSAILAQIKRIKRELK
ncbi:MAG: argininosuccinate lyase [bacterium]|nr:MAG: argininosuccinate lyase [bacterium]